MRNDRDRITITGDDGEEIILPSKLEICDTCGGEGHNSLHIDGHGLGAEELAEWDDEERETYFRGGYDQRCSPCHGTGKVRVVDRTRCTPEQLRLWDAWMEDEAAYQAQVDMERRMGC